MKLKYITLFLIFLTGTLFRACENDIEKINMLNTSEKFPNITGEDVELIYSDSARVKVKVTARELRQYSHAEEPYVEFPQGIIVEFFDKNLVIESRITANYAIYYQADKLWKATGQVVAQNLKKGERLETEEMFWDEDKELIYSETYTKIINENGIFYGQHGFQSDQTLNEPPTLLGGSGIINIEEDE